MKKILFLFLAVFIIQTTFVLAVPEIQMSESFKQGETMIIKVSGNFYESLSENKISFYTGHVVTSVPFSVRKLENGFYISAQLIDKNPGNYSIILEDVKYFEGNKIIEGDLSKNFSVTEEFADFSVDKGFVITGENFYIEIRNLGDKEIDVSYVYNENSGTSKLKVGETKKIGFNASSQGQSLISLSSENSKYEIPVYIFAVEEKEKTKNFRFEPFLLNVTMSTNSETETVIYVNNVGNLDIENVSLEISESLKPYVFILTGDIGSMVQNSKEMIVLKIVSPQSEKKVSGFIRAVENSQDEEILPVQSEITLNFLKDFSSVAEVKGSTTVSETCSNLNGSLCTGLQKCSGEIKYASDGVCCILPASCEEAKSGGSAGKIIGWVIMILIVILAFWFYLFKYKNIRTFEELVNFFRS